MKKTIQREYAKLIAKSGVAVKKNDAVIIQADLDQPDFIAMLVDECYKAGAERVMVEWSYQKIQKLHIRHQKAKVLGKVEDFEEAKIKYRLEKNPAMIYILSDDPNGLAGINQAKYSKAMQERMKVIKPYRDQMDNKYKWCIAAVPGNAWAKKVFPGVRTTLAVEKLWEAILFTSRVIDNEGQDLDPVAEWKAHNESFRQKCAYLNDLHIIAQHLVGFDTLLAIAGRAISHR